MIDELIKHPRPLQMALQPASIRFILLQVRDEPVAEAPDHMAKAIDIIAAAQRHGVDVMSSIGAGVVRRTGQRRRRAGPRPARKSVARLVTELGQDIRLVYGTADGLVGNFGSPQRCITARCCPASRAISLH